jgi:hypothetical protein
MPVKRSEEIVEILEAYDLTSSYRAAAELAGCDHHTVARYVALRAAGEPAVTREHPARPIDDYLDKIEELVARSNGRVLADVVHARLVAMGFTGGERTTRRAVAEVKARLRAGQRRVFRPWVAEPGLWRQWDRGEGSPRRRKAHEPVVRLAGPVPVPRGHRGVGRTLPTIVGCLDTTLRRIGGVPNYALVDNERTVSNELSRFGFVRGERHGRGQPQFARQRGQPGVDPEQHQARPRPAAYRARVDGNTCIAGVQARTRDQDAIHFEQRLRYRPQTVPTDRNDNSPANASTHDSASRRTSSTANSNRSEDTAHTTPPRRRTLTLSGRGRKFRRGCHAASLWFSGWLSWASIRLSRLSRLWRVNFQLKGVATAL